VARSPPRRATTDSTLSHRVLGCLCPCGSRVRYLEVPATLQHEEDSSRDGERASLLQYRAPDPLGNFASHQENRSTSGEPIRVSRRGVLVSNTTYDIPVYAAVYYKRLGADRKPGKAVKRDCFFRFTSLPQRIQPGGHLRFAKPSVMCRHTSFATLFFSSSIEQLQPRIFDRFADRIGSHSVCLTLSLRIGVQDEVLEAFNDREWCSRVFRPIRLPTETIQVRTPFSISETNEEPPRDDDCVSIGDMLLSSLDSMSYEEPVRESIKPRESGVAATREELGRVYVDPKRLTKTSSVPMPDRKSKHYRPPTRMSIPEEERSVREKRSAKCQKALLRYLPEIAQVIDDLGDGHQPKWPTIGLCLSGGSYRALVRSTVIRK
jgi:hypothetical protein